MKIKTKNITFITLLLLSGCTKNYEELKYQLQDAAPYHEAVQKLTDVIVYDIFSPPVVSRIYAYPNIAAYEILAREFSEYKSLAGQLTDLTAIPEAEQNIAPSIAAIHAFLTVAKVLIFSENQIKAYQEHLYQQIKSVGISSTVFKNSIEYADRVAKHILDWVDKDQYKQTRTYPRYTLREETAAWKPTPPDYMEGVEPHWNKIRPFVIDSANQFVPVAPTKFNMQKNSTFYKELLQVYEVGLNLSDEQEQIARFWDCNPYVSHHTGHAMFAVKKITPGGHWIGITKIACNNKNLNLMQTVEAYTRVSIALADAFISCWDEKWRSILVRPETLINEYIDERWMPLLQTPPFPEYTSGHSVISNAAATILTDLLGDKFYFADSTELSYGLPVRNFNSFFEASGEAAISRLYGGIHYMPAIENGLTQGKAVGDFIVHKLQTH